MPNSCKMHIRVFSVMATDAFGLVLSLLVAFCPYSWILICILFYTQYLRNTDIIYLLCKYLNAKFECNGIVISVYSHYPYNQNAKSSDTKCFTLCIKCFCIRIKSWLYVKIKMSLHSNLAFRNLQCRWLIKGKIWSA